MSFNSAIATFAASSKPGAYTAIGPVITQNYIDGIHSPVNGLIMPTNKSYPTVALGIKNDNNTNARPQSGPQSADAVFEVLVEGGMTRFINVFYQSDTTYHGPIRSARPTDPTVLRPFDGVLVAAVFVFGFDAVIKFSPSACSKSKNLSLGCCSDKVSLS